MDRSPLKHPEAIASFLRSRLADDSAAIPLQVGQTLTVDGWDVARVRDSSSDKLTLDWLADATAPRVAQLIREISLQVQDVDQAQEVDFDVSLSNGIGHLASWTQRVDVAPSDSPTSPVIHVSPAGPGGRPDPSPKPGQTSQPTSWTQQRSSIRLLTVDLSTVVVSVSPADIVLTNLGVDALRWRRRRRSHHLATRSNVT